MLLMNKFLIGIFFFERQWMMWII